MVRLAAVPSDRPDLAARRPPEVGAEYRFAGWRLNLLRRDVWRPDGRPVDLTGGEFGLLCAFIERPQRVLGRAELLELARCRGGDILARAVDVQVSRLRRKLSEGDPASPELIRTLRGRGYMFMPEATFTANLGRF